MCERQTGGFSAAIRPEHPSRFRVRMSLLGTFGAFREGCRVGGKLAIGFGFAAGKAIARVTIKKIPKIVVDSPCLCCSFECLRPLYPPLRLFQTAFDG